MLKIDRVYNLKQSYETLGPVRNYCNCKLIKEETGEVVKEFRSKIEAARYANENFGCSISFISKGNKVSKGYKILNKDFFNEFVIETENSDNYLNKLKSVGILGGLKLDEKKVLVSVTEMNSQEDIDLYLKNV